MYQSEMLSGIDVTLLVDCCCSVRMRAMDILAMAAQNKKRKEKTTPFGVKLMRSIMPGCPAWPHRLVCACVVFIESTQGIAGMLTGRTGPRTQRYSGLYVTDSRGRHVIRTLLIIKPLSSS